MVELAKEIDFKKSQSCHRSSVFANFTNSCVNNFEALKSKSLTQFDSALERLQVFFWNFSR